LSGNHVLTFAFETLAHRVAAELILSADSVFETQKCFPPRLAATQSPPIDQARPDAE
jgi:hypothetical protein